MTEIKGTQGTPPFCFTFLFELSQVPKVSFASLTTLTPVNSVPYTENFHYFLIRKKNLLDFTVKIVSEKKFIKYRISVRKFSNFNSEVVH